MRLRVSRPEVQHADVGLDRRKVGEALADLAAAQDLEPAAEPPPHVPDRRCLGEDVLRDQVQASDLVEVVAIEDPAESLEQVEAYGTGTHLGLRAQEHCDYAARLEAGAAAHAAFVHDNDALDALLYEVEGGAKTGYAGADDYDGLRPG